jgi:hypothetical protein
MRFALSAAGFVLIALALGLFIWAGYEMSLIATDYYTSYDRQTIEPLLGVVLASAATMTFTGLGLRKLSKRRRWR